MKLEDGEWCVTELTNPNGYERIDLEDPETIAEMVHSPVHESEEAALGNLRMLVTALISYNAGFPNVGYPDKLDALGESLATGEPDSDHAQFIDMELARTHIKTGYQFEYQKTSHDSYQISARLLEFGKTGSRNFFVDESGVIRFTLEDREATASDPIVGEDFRRAF
jgi:hypothetical protein